MGHEAAVPPHPGLAVLSVELIEAPLAGHAHAWSPGRRGAASFAVRPPLADRQDPPLSSRALRRVLATVIAALAHRIWAPVLLVVLAAAALVPDCGAPGLWEPQELAVADRAAARVDAPEAPAAPHERPSRSCKDAPDQDGDGVADLGGARSLTERATAWGFGTIGGDRGMRLPLELLGLITVLAIAGIAYRLIGARAALLTGLVCLSFPLLALQSRQLTSEIGTAAGGALIMYGLAFAARPAPGRWAILDGAIAAIAAVAGAYVGFAGGGALLGVLVPIGAFALATGGGVAALGAMARLVVYGVRRVSDGRSGRSPARLVLWPLALLPARQASSVDDALGMARRRFAFQLVGLAATITAVVVLGVLASQAYDIREPVPGSRQLAGHSIIPSDCWSTALGGVWKFDDNLRVLHDAGMAQIAVGTYPWGILAPLALGLLLMSGDRGERTTGRLAVAWAALAWLCTALFLRKVGFTIYAGFPAMALGIGVWLDGVLRVTAANVTAGEPDASRGAGARIVALLFFALGVLVLAKDFLAFPDELTTLLVDIEINTKEAKVYPKAASIAGLPAKAAVAAMGLVLVVAVIAALIPVGEATGEAPLPASWMGRKLRIIVRAIRWLTGSFARARGAVALTIIALTAAIGLFWTHGWHRALSKNLSSKQVFTTYDALRADGDRLGIMGKMGNAPRFYGAGAYDELTSRERVVEFLHDGPGRSFAMVPFADLCGVHRATNGKPYFVLDYSSTRTILLSNKVDGGSDQNPLATRILREEPTALITGRPPSPIVYDGKIELVGWSLPAKIERGDSFTVRLVFKVRAAISGSWKVFAHFDGRGARFQGDHDPIDKVCATSWWQPDDYVVDTFTVEAGDRSTPQGPHEVRIGFFTGSSPNWRNMKVSTAPAGALDDNDRVKIGSVVVD